MELITKREIIIIDIPVVIRHPASKDRQREGRWDPPHVNPIVFHPVRAQRTAPPPYTVLYYRDQHRGQMGGGLWKGAINTYTCIIIQFCEYRRANEAEGT